MFAKMGKGIVLTKKQIGKLDDEELEKGLRNTEFLTGEITRKLKEEKERRIKQAQADAKRPSVEVTSIVFDDGENYGGDYRIVYGGSVQYKDGWAGELKALNGKKLSNKQIAEIAEQEGKKIDPDNEEQVSDYANEKQNDNTYNGSSAIYPDINFGFFKVGDKTLMSFKEHGGSGDIRGGYGDNEIWDVSEVDLGFTGEPDGDLIPFMYPRINVNLKIGEKSFTYSDDGGMSGADDFYDIDNNKDISKTEFEKIAKDLKTFDISEARDRWSEKNKEFS